MLDKVPGARLVDEIVGARRDIEAELGSCPPVFSYSAGQWSQQIERTLQQASYEIAFTTQTGTNRLHDIEWLALKRINASRAATRVILRGVLMPSVRGHRRGSARRQPVEGADGESGTPQGACTHELLAQTCVAEHYIESHCCTSGGDCPDIRPLPPQLDSARGRSGRAARGRHGDPESK